MHVSEKTLLPYVLPKKENVQIVKNYPVLISVGDLTKEGNPKTENRSEVHSRK